MNTLRAATLSAMALLAACAGSFPTIDEERQSASSGLIGCPPKAITVSDHQRYTWTAQCAGRTFYCTAAPALACTPAMEPPRR
jgi:hypothetical protein